MFTGFLVRVSSFKWVLVLEAVASVFFILYSSHAKGQSCTLPSRIFLPTADHAIFEDYGNAIDVDGNYMVVGVDANSEDQVYSGKAIVYKLGVDNQWYEIAQLHPSKPAKYLTFGNSVAIYGNTIVVTSREFNDLGIARSNLVFFEKNPGDEWTSTTESYTISQPFGTYLEQYQFGQLELQDNELVVLSILSRKSKIEIYTKTGGVFSLSQAIDTPLGNGYGYAWNLAIDQDIIAITNEQYQHANGSNGAVFVYPKVAGVYSTTPKVLGSIVVPDVYALMGYAISINNSNTIFVEGVFGSNGSYSQTTHIFEMPAGGWVDATQPFTLQTPGYAIYQPKMVSSDNYLFYPGQDYKSIIGFKKPAGGWSSSAVSFSIQNDAVTEQSLLGYQLRVDDNHLVLGCPARFSYTQPGQELILHYYSPTGMWELGGAIPQSLIGISDINATDDFFGKAISIYDDWLAVNATGDDENGVNSGVVYLFDARGSKTDPEQKIHNYEQENYTGFGQGLTLGDSILFIGSPYKDSLNTDGTVAFYNIGKVYVYRLTSSGWEYSTQIKSPFIRSEGSFGRTVAWSAGYCAVTEFYGGSSEEVGHVYIYKENKETGEFDYIASLDPAVHLRFDFFGQSMQMTDSLIVIGTGNLAPNSSYRTSAYIFKKKGEWQTATEDARLYSSDAGWSDRFGASVSMYGQYIVVGAPYSPGYDPRPIPRDYIITGAAYIFKMPASGWKGELTEIAKLLPSDPTDFGTFGTTVAIDHNDIFIGSPNEYAQYNVVDKTTNDDNRLIPGKVYHYKKPAGEWSSTNQEFRQIQSFEPEFLDGYGAAMYISDRFLYVGAMLDDTPAGFRTGSVQTIMQLPVIDDTPPQVCFDHVAYPLKGFPKNGNWSGPGVHPTTGLFTPAIAGVGIHTIIYERSGCVTSVQIEVVDDHINISHQSEELQEKCIGSTIPVTLESDIDQSHYRWYYKELFDQPLAKVDSFKQTLLAQIPGYYEAEIKREICPDYRVLFQVKDEDEVNINIESAEVICDDKTQQLSATPASGVWESPYATADGIFNPVDLSDGSYPVSYSVTTPLGCLWSKSVDVQVDRLVPPTLEYNNKLICGDDLVKLAVTNLQAGSAIHWYGPQSNIESENSSTVTLRQAGTYWAEVSRYSCTLSTISVDVDVVVDTLYVPNVITPNDDSYNDHFMVFSDGIEDFYLSVVNRYGSIVFETADPAFQWTASNVSSGIYFWTVQYSNCSDVKKSQKGWIQVFK